MDNETRNFIYQTSFAGFVDRIVIGALLGFLAVGVVFGGFALIEPWRSAAGFTWKGVAALVAVVAILVPTFWAIVWDVVDRVRDRREKKLQKLNAKSVPLPF